MGEGIRLWESHLPARPPGCPSDDIRPLGEGKSGQLSRRELQRTWAREGGLTPQGDLEARLDRARRGSKTKARRSQGQVSGGWGVSEEGRGGDLDPRMRATFQGSPRTGPRLSALL